LNLQDSELIQKLKDMVKNERELLTEILRHLQEVERRKLFFGARVFVDVRILHGGAWVFRGRGACAHSSHAADVGGADGRGENRVRRIVALCGG